MTHPTTFQYFSLIIYKLVLYQIVNRIVGGVSWYVSYRGSAYRYTPSLDNGLAPNRPQAIIWTNADPIHWRIYAALVGDNLMILYSP